MCGFSVVLVDLGVEVPLSKPVLVKVLGENKNRTCQGDLGAGGGLMIRFEQCVFSGAGLVFRG